MDFVDKDIPLNFIREKRLLSERSLNNCARAGLNSLFGILEHYYKHNSFIGNGCGVKSNVEMIKFCNFYLNNPQKINNLFNEYNTDLITIKNK